MTTQSIFNQDVGGTRQSNVENENASGATEAFNLRDHAMNVTDELVARNNFKQMLLGSIAEAHGESHTKFDEGFDIDGDLIVLSDDSYAASDVNQKDKSDVSAATQNPPDSPEFRYKLLTADDLCNIAPMKWRIKNVLPARGTAVMYGPSGSGKSFLVLDMLQSLALGKSWFGHKVEQCSVTYIALEGEAGVSGRVKAYVTRYGLTAPNIRFAAQPFSLQNADDVNELAEAIKAESSGDVVVVDTLSRASVGLDENDSKAMGQIIAAAKALQEEIYGLVLLIHHTGKDASKGPRGHSSLYAALDCAIEVRGKDDRREWLVAKSKDGEDGASYPFKLEDVLLGHDDDGDEITSCVVVPVDAEQVCQKKTLSLGSNQDIAYNALREALSKSVDVEKEGAPPGKPCIGFNDALAIVTPLIPATAKRQKERAKDAIKRLVTMSALGQMGNWLWDNQTPQM